MPIAPTFAPSMVELRASLRLSDVKSGDPSVMIDDAVREVRLGFIRELGASMVTALVNTVYDPEAGAPATNDEVRREIANMTEIAWVKKLLLERLPAIFRDSSGEANLDWQRDALTREMGDFQRKALIDQLDRQVKEGIEALLGGQPDAATYTATTFEPVNPPIMGGSSKDASGHYQLGD